MRQRQAIPKDIETQLLTACRRRCCLCVFLNQRDDIRKGQIAHLNHNPADWRFENLAWLCLEHHDEYDSQTSQSKSLQLGEVKNYRDKLYRRYDSTPPHQRHAVSAMKLKQLPHLSDYERLERRFKDDLEFIKNPWRYPLWQVENRPDFFAYKAGNGADGICLLERIDLPDGRIVMACIEVAGNPGNSITNCVEELCFQVCSRFEIPPDQLIWLEHYDSYREGREWTWVTFDKQPPEAPFTNPRWTEMTPELWRNLRLQPRKTLTRSFGQYDSKIKKLF
jgi:hypothetical protein